MSSLRSSYIRKRRSDDESSDSDSEDEGPPVKKFRSCNGDTNIKQGFSTKIYNIFNWISHLPLRRLFKESVLTRTMQRSVDEVLLEDDDEQAIVIDITDKEENIDVIDIADDEDEDDMIVEGKVHFFRRLKNCNGKNCKVRE
ncbi:hypothetical protein TNCT_158761 [Trichonephila clavata]|uniref:Uncharacterized protein n=1 Tax=Trichonephila clavata TaxID=2740835 RepID=A0A8X6F147_TRICU|nr:hypothetical protein TNCT_158761 [Trichonephila clavata]